MARANIILPTIGLPIITEDAKILVALDALEASLNNVETEQLTDRATEFRVFEAPQTWQTTALSAEFGVGVTLKYYRDVMGVVRVRGDSYALSSDLTGVKTIATLPVGYRPDATAHGIVTQYDGTAQFSLPVIINTTGTIVTSDHLSTFSGPAVLSIQFRGA